MPKTARYTLVWSPSHQTYELHEIQSSGVQEVVPESPAWFAWMDQVTSFAFHGRNGSYTMYKERKQRGEGYWYAYVRVKGRLSKRYLGRGIDLTLPRLEQVAHELWQDIPDTQWQKGNDPVDQSRQTLSDLLTDPLLATKLYIPRPRPHLVHRPRLLQYLQQGMERTLTLISAPVGFGKSTLLSDWLTSRAIPAAWLSLEPQDNEPTRFLSYLLAALQTHDPHLGMSIQVLHPPLQPSSMEVMLTLLINDLLRRATTQDHLVLVLDNYHVITDESIHQALSFLLEHLPSWMHLVLATREDPPLPLARLRGRNDLLELRATDLRFTQEEADIFLTQVMGLPLSQEESALLQTRTEGWITGLQLAAFSLQDRDDVGTFIMAFSGSHHYVVDYLLEEVLKRQSAAIQDFLLQTCILDRLCASLCDAVREQNGSQTLLDYLERANLFLVALDDEGQWYRYHRLFAEALRQLLQQMTPALIPHLHLRASCWYQQQGLDAEKVSHTRATPVLQPGPPIKRLTTREREVLQLLLKGASNREIGHHLVLSMNTVKKHVLNICRKLEVRSRAQVIAKTRTLHLL
ncbi:MAG: hypothetical protein NVSMB49_10620 [Ktedonobacteraceae bacterium]